MAIGRGVLLLGFLLLAGAAEAQNLLPPDWSFQPGGDAAGLSAAAIGTPAGAAFNAGLSWERQGFHNGEPACLTVDFPAPAAWRETGLRYEFALRADRVELCVNGRRIATATGAGQRVTGELPRELLRWGGPNRLSLRVEGHQWTGGEVPDLVRVFPTGGADAPLTLAAEPPRPWHEYAAEEEVVLPVRLRATAQAGRVAGTLHVRVESDFHERMLAQEVAYVATPDGAPLALRLGRLAPGFYAVSLRTTAADFSLAQDLWIAVAPTRIAAAPAEPACLADYWDRARAELAQVAPEFRVTPEPALDTDRQRVFTVAMRSVGGVELRAWLVTPARAGRYPAILHLPGYGVGLQPQWFLDGRADVVHLALDIRGHGRSAGQVNPGFGLPGFVGHQIHDAEAYVYRGAFLDCGRALEFLATRTEVDAARIAVEGMSQGGGLAFATAALFPGRVAACAAGVPFLGVPQDHFRIRPVYREEMEQHLRLAGRGTWADTLRSLELVNPWHLAPRITCPVFMAVALRDDDCPPHLGFAVYNRLNVPRSYRIFPAYGHLMNGEWPATAGAWLRRQLGLPE